MISKVAIVQPVCDYHNQNQDLHKPKEGLNKKKSISFASVLEHAIKSQFTGK